MENEKNFREESFFWITINFFSSTERERENIEKSERAENWMAINADESCSHRRPATSRGNNYGILCVVWHRVLIAAAIIDTREYLFLGTLRSRRL